MTFVGIKIDLNRSKRKIPASPNAKDPLYRQIVVESGKDGDITVGYAERGNNSADTLIISFHGGPSSRLEGIGTLKDWLGNVNESRMKNIKVIAIDRPGHGLSSYYEYI